MLEENNESGEISDCDICDTQELNELFTSKCELTCEEIINEDKYVLHMTGTLYSTLILLNISYNGNLILYNVSVIPRQM